MAGSEGEGSAVSGGGAKKTDEEDFDPAKLITYDVVVMDEQALEAQRVAALGACREMLKTSRSFVGIQLPPQPGPPPSSGGLVPASASTLGSSTGTDGGLPSA
ncbi:hypothetical protein EI94DRAFT_1708074 [Lactarius quietus]|nr:hypothetical protein EI94DRAFT_1708074 [Lactarius quietus]